MKLCLLLSAFQRWENQGIEAHTANEEQSRDASFQKFKDIEHRAKDERYLSS